MATLENQTQTQTQTQTSCKNEEEEACLYAMQLASISVLPMVLKSTIELDVLEIIAKSGPGACISPSEIASKLSTTKNPEAHLMLDRMLRLLASYKVLTCTMHTLEDGHVERLYGLAPVCKFFVRNEDGVSIAPFMLLNQDKVVMESWYYLKDAVLDGGIPFYKAHGMGAHDYTRTDSRFNMFFNKVMSDHSMILIKKILETYKGFEGSETIVDVAGGTGTTLKMIISKYPTIKGVNFDLPHVIKDAPSYTGIEHVGGDMFVSVPKADTIFMKLIIHNWSDEHSLKCLKNCYAALPENGKVIIVEAIVPEFLETNAAANGIFHIDCIMLAQISGGKERTEKEFEALAKGAGFADFRVIFCAYNTWVMEFRKMK
ncbi:hypothetical protein GIB67_030532 [Kingdonia uniflora]|uniref:Caffeic acid O-methyltransferase n=1 Tax=Kingdonia uniflora TaxID=39325 RepID=A0A7J7L4V8_9MAGN|nr:hypothetical protein GIB67_030532 [Kingdonia uniflora]